MGNTNLWDNLISSQSTLIIVLVVNIALILGLLYYIVRQNRHIDQLEAAMKPKYGFLGKPLFSFFAVLMMVGGFAAIYAVSENISDVSVGGNDQVEIQIEVKPGKEVSGGREVSFKVIPSINGVEWGGESSGAKFEAYWTVDGPLTFSEFESKITFGKHGGFTKVLPHGNYHVVVNVSYLEQSYITSINVGI